MNGQWMKDRWKELRYGLGNYVNMVITFVNLVLLLNLNYGLSYFEAVVVFLGMTALATVIGHLHRKVQQSTDALIDNEAVIEEIVRRLKKEE